MRSTDTLSLDSPTGGEFSSDDGKCLWSTILKEVTHKASFKLPSTRALIVLGDDESGKTTLIAKLQGTEDPKESFGLEYTFIDIKDEDRDDQTKLNVWILDGDVVHNRLLKFALNAENFGECMVMIVVNIAEPGKIVESLEKWAEVLEKHIKRLNIPMETLSEYKNGLIRQFREYVEPDLLIPPSTPAPIAHVPLATAPINPRRHLPQGLHPATAALLSSTLGKSQVAPSAPINENGGLTEGTEPHTVPELPLDPSALVDNLGIPIVVVVTKTDTMNTLEKEERFTEEHFDFIQMHIRRFCLRFGASLFYVSVKENKHCDLLKRYLQSRIYGFPFTQAAYVVERDCVFVPTGWDNEKKIAILEENLAQIRSGDAYNSVIPCPPAPRKVTVSDPEVVAQEEQSFLTRLSTLMQRDLASSGVASSVTSPDAMLEPLSSSSLSQASPGSPATVARQGTASPRTSLGGYRSKPTPPGSGPNASGNAAGSVANSRAAEGVLAQFFTNLLNKKSNVAGGSPASTATPPQGSDKLSMSPKDIQSELERLARSSREALEANKTPKSQSSPATEQTPKNDVNAQKESESGTQSITE